MNNTPTTSTHKEEIDLGYIMSKVNQGFKKAVKLFFELINFFIKFKFVVLTLLVLAIIYGYYKDTLQEPVFDNQVIVIPNFESVDYLYDKVEALNQKIKSKDTDFLRSILDTNYRNIGIIEVEPIVDIYNFVSKSRENIDIFRIFIQSQDVKEYVDEISNSKYYKYHRLRFNIRGDGHSEEIISNLMKFFNDNEHFNNYGEIFRNNIQFQVEEHQKMVSQIDSLLASMSNINKSNSNQGVFIFESTDVHLLMERKKELLDEILGVEMKMLDYEQIIKFVSADYELELKPFLSNSSKYPLFIIILFILLFFIKNTYNRLKEIAQSN